MGIGRDHVPTTVSIWQRLMPTQECRDKPIHRCVLDEGSASRSAGSASMVGPWSDGDGSSASSLKALDMSCIWSCIERQ